MKNMKKNQGGFTLLELLVVVGIMAIIGGAMLSSFGGQEDKAARGAATQTIAGVESAFRIYKATTNNLPNELESLACLPLVNAADPGAVTTVVNDVPASPADATSAYKFGGVSNASGIGGGLGKKVADKFSLVQIPAGGITALADVGITSLRYAATAACDNEAPGFGTTTVTFAGGEVIGVDAALQDMDIPAHAFEDPRPGSNRNRGRGFSGTLTADSPMMLWNNGGGYNNTKVGGQAGSVLVGMGLGQASDLVGSGVDAAFAKAPFYGQLGKDKYSHYIALVEVGIDSDVDGDSNPATPAGFTQVNWLDDGGVSVVAVVDARGDFLDEEMAEFTGQKQ